MVLSSVRILELFIIHQNKCVFYLEARFMLLFQRYSLGVIHFEDFFIQTVALNDFQFKWLSFDFLGFEDRFV